MITSVILAGGTGSRLWPLSRGAYPKQFLPLTGSQTMLQETLARLEGLPCRSNIIICNEEHRFIAAEQLRQLQTSHTILLEPIGRNTAPAVALAALLAIENSEDPVLLVLAADHVIENKQAFDAAVEQALPLAESGKLVTFGIVPTKPEIGYGYIKRADLLADGSSYSVSHFEEKPDLLTATGYVNSGEYYWNSGMFMFRASRYLEELAEHCPDMLAACNEAMRHTSNDLDFIRVDKDAFERCPEDSIDYAVMEKTKDAVLVPLNAGWSDVGSWSALWDIGKKDNEGNVVLGDATLHNSKNSFVHATNRLVALLGVEDIVVIETKDAILVASKEHVQDVKSVVNTLKKEGRNEVSLHREVYRPWGKYDSIDLGHRYQVKRITVNPGEKLSVQMHYHRAEHWIVVSGTAKVTNGDKVSVLTENQSTYIPIGAVHSLENPGKVLLEIIEVQSGSYLGEDDIVRFSDQYGRA